MFSEVHSQTDSFHPHVVAYVCAFLALLVLGSWIVVQFLITFGFFTSESWVLPELTSAHRSLGIGGISIAISTQIGTGSVTFANTSPDPSQAPSVAISTNIGQIAHETEGFLQEHFRALDAYTTVLSTNVSDLLASANDRSDALDAYIDELAFRRADAVDRVTNLQVQSDVFSDELASLAERISGYQQAIAAGYDSRNEAEVLEALESIEQLRGQEVQIRSQRAFVDKFIQDFSARIRSTDPILETIEPNRDLLISGQSVQIPNSGTSLLEQLGSIQFNTTP